ncbi:hypothetical protein [Thalassobacillus sp. CUG 92003]|uniref:hypothetical protein n=1 Tax=Thalassobacillus sp. CUG 92003 TaxID=2736641 RepID=UPI0015E6F5A4|nr:hypothetical protein [Thalassobacillus sp. CUG 92003]
MKRIFDLLIFPVVVVIIAYFISGDSGNLTSVTIGGLFGAGIVALIWIRLQRKK